MKFKLNDTNEIIEAKDYSELVTIMRINSFTRTKTNKEYMMGYAHRAVLSKNEDIHATNETDFINDLIKHQHISLV